MRRVVESEIRRALLQSADGAPFVAVDPRLGAEIPNGYLTLPPKPARKVVESDIQRAVLVAVSRLAGVRAARNNVGTITDHRGVPVTFGLGEGSPDLMLVITFGGPQGRFSALHERTGADPWAFAYGLEIKQPGRYRTRIQKAWALAAERRGLRSACVRSDVEACAAVEAECARLSRYLA